MTVKRIKELVEENAALELDISRHRGQHMAGGNEEGEVGVASDERSTSTREQLDKKLQELVVEHILLKQQILNYFASNSSKNDKQEAGVGDHMTKNPRSPMTTEDSGDQVTEESCDTSSCSDGEREPTEMEDHVEAEEFLGSCDNLLDSGSPSDKEMGEMEPEQQPSQAAQAVTSQGNVASTSPQPATSQENVPSTSPQPAASQHATSQENALSTSPQPATPQPATLQENVASTSPQLATSQPATSQENVMQIQTPHQSDPQTSHHISSSSTASTSIPQPWPIGVKV